MPHQRNRHIDDALGQAARVHQLTGQHEERHGHQRETVSPIDQALGNDLRIEQVEVIHHGQGTQDQCIGNWHANRHGTEQGDYEYCDDEHHITPVFIMWRASPVDGGGLAGELLMEFGGDVRAMDFTTTGQPHDFIKVNGAGRHPEEHSRAVKQPHRPAGDR
ncbi:hypothetical protein D9M68_879550 [compost metagenome]